MSLIGGFIGVVYRLCLYTLAVRACPPGIERTVFGLVMATITLAGMLQVGSARETAPPPTYSRA